MELRFIGQGYNLDINSSVGNELISGLINKEYNTFQCLVAFASRAGISALTPHVIEAKKHMKSIRVIVGIDQKGTSSEALQELLSWNVETFVYYTTQRIIFHPKIYLFNGQEKNLVIIGSNNLTENGLTRNVEASVAIEFYSNEDKGQSFFKEIQKYFKPIFYGEGDNLQRLTPALIERLVMSGLVPNEAQRRALYAKEDNNDENNQKDDKGKNISDLFGRAGMQKRPEGFVPARATKQNEKDIQKVAPEAIIEEDEQGMIKEGQLVLVAEISGGDRWKQANFDIGTFEGFFGATAGNNDYFISLRHVTADSQIEEEEQSQAVTVQSSNYRFELRAASGIAFPTNGYPIGTFIKIGQKIFLYNLAMPDYDYYAEIRDFLDSKWTGSLNRRKRIITDIRTLKAGCPNLPFWNI